MNLVDKYGHARCDDYISVNDESVIKMKLENSISHFFKKQAAIFSYHEHSLLLILF